ncbi:MAG: phosphotransferase [Pseudomonadota bacterium]|nr:phosphotransferase [Pseudomonadota bacterium]
MGDPAFDPEVVAARLGRELGLEPRIVRARDGREHHLFRVVAPAGLTGPDDPGGERLLKFPRADALPDPFDLTRPAADRLRTEGVVLATVRGAQVPSPYRVFGTDPVCAIMGVIAGTTAEVSLERGQLDEAGLAGLCLQMGRTLAAIHGTPRPDGGGGIPDLADCPPRGARLLHLDYHLGNVLGRPMLRSGWTITGVVDWTCSRWGPVEADLVEMQACVFVLNPRARDAFVAGYRQASGRAIDMVDVEERTAWEIRRRLVCDRPASDELARRWEDWVERHG